MKIHNKLVRDKIPGFCKDQGEAPKTLIIKDDREYLSALCDKLIEEAHEVKEDSSLEELADVLEVVYGIAKILGYSREQIESTRIQKAKERGGFEDRIFLISTD
jgi:predicted house-cleaning noncanonical NTP pyrophosphatase (MazG superfamily)